MATANEHALDETMTNEELVEFHRGYKSAQTDERHMSIAQLRAAMQAINPERGAYWKGRVKGLAEALARKTL